MLKVTRQTRVNAPPSFAAKYLRDISNLPEYEQKVEKCVASYPDEATATADVAGRFMGLPWKASFHMEFTDDGGFRSRMTKGPLGRMQGGFVLKPVSGGVQITHYEEYGFSVLLAPIYPLIRRWLGRSMEVELGLIKEGVERLHRHTALASLDGEVRV